MAKYFTRMRWIILGLSIPFAAILSAQPVLHNATDLYMGSGLTIYAEGDVFNAAGGSFHNAGLLLLGGNLTNNGQAELSSPGGEVSLVGTTLQMIDGSTVSSFSNLRVENGSRLGQNILVNGQVIMFSDDLDLNGKELELGPTGEIAGETNDHRIFGAGGTITTTRDLAAFSTPTNVAGMGLTISSGRALGLTTIERTHTSQDVGNGSSIERSFNIMPANANEAVLLRIHYFEEELNGQNAATLRMFRKPPGSAVWQIGEAGSTGTGFVEAGLFFAAGSYTLSSDGTTPVRNLLSGKNIRYYPNPISTDQSLKLEGLAPGAYQLRLFDMAGRKIWDHIERVSTSGGLLELEIPSALASGMYTLQVISNDPAAGSGGIKIQIH